MTSVKKYVALGQAPASVSILATTSHHLPNSFRFSVLNGGWSGYFKDGQVKVTATGQTQPADILWTADERPCGDYNEDIKAIEKELLP